MFGRLMPKEGKYFDLFNAHADLIAQGGQSPDHPVHPAMPETRYLKALFARVCR